MRSYGVYYQFVPHHVRNPRHDLDGVKSVLKSSGIDIGIERIISYAYSHPAHLASQSPNLSYEISEDNVCKGTLDKMIPHLIRQAAMECIESLIFWPLFN